MDYHHNPELVNEKETPPAQIKCAAGSHFRIVGLLIQTVPDDVHKVFRNLWIQCWSHISEINANMIEHFSALIY